MNKVIIIIIIIMIMIIIIIIDIDIAPFPPNVQKRIIQKIVSEKGTKVLARRVSGII